MKQIKSGISANAANREHLRAMFNELIRLGHWYTENPVIKVRQFSVSQTELTYLTSPQIDVLFKEPQQSRSSDVLKDTGH